MALTTSVGMPPTRRWTLRNARSGETREFQQSELPIEGEARLLAIVNDTAVKLVDTGFAFEKVPALFDDGPTDWDVVRDLLGAIVAFAPDAIVDATTALLNIYPTNEDGTRNAEYDKDWRFLKGSVKSTTFVEMLQWFAETNDYQRLAAPFGEIIGRAMAPVMTDQPSTTPMSDTSETAEISDDSSKPSTPSSPKATARRRRSSAG